MVRIEKPDPARHPGVTEDGGGPYSLRAHSGPSVGRPSPSGGGVRMLAVVTNREVAVVPAPRTEAWASHSVRLAAAGLRRS